jgi:AAA+ superfamily predicted ATPase
VDDPVLAALRRAVAAAPDDSVLRLHLAEQLTGAGRGAEAVTEVAVVLQREPDNGEARALMARALGAGSPAAPAPPTSPTPATTPTPPGAPEAPPPEAVGDVHDEPPADAPASPSTTSPATGPEFDWASAEQDIGEIAAPMFVSADDAPPADGSQFDVERSTVTLRDVGGMQQVKDRLEAAFLAPSRNPELRKLYGKSLRGGLLLYGPPGCGKTFIARAVAGELGAGFVSIGISDVLDMYVGNSERNLSAAFRLARQKAPCVLFFDEIDALGQRRTSSNNAVMRNTVNQFLTELDGVDGLNEGVFVLAATNQPWDVDPALRRPGRLDRTLLVLPPDVPARVEIFRYHLSTRPVEGIDLTKLAKASDGFSGADIAYVCEVASERALMDSARSGQVRLIGMADLEAALAQTTPSLGPWLETARNVVMFANQDGGYDELRDYLKRRRRL